MIFHQAPLSSGDWEAGTRSILKAVIFILEVGLFDNLTSILLKLQIIVGRLTGLDGLRLVPRVTQLHRRLEYLLGGFDDLIHDDVFLYVLDGLIMLEIVELLL